MADSRYANIRRMMVTVLLAIICRFVWSSPIDSLGIAPTSGFEIEDIVTDIYTSLMESGEFDYEDLRMELLDIAATPIDLNNTSEDELRRLRFLSDAQIEEIMLLVHRQPLVSLYELQRLSSLKRYELRNLLFFVTIGESAEDRERVYAKEVMRNAKHELDIRLDARDIEKNKPDPFYTSFRYRFTYQQRYQAAFTLRRPVGADGRGLEYGAYIELHDIWRFKTIVAGNFQAQFGQGLVMASPFHTGKSAYVLNCASAPQGLRKYSGTDGASLHGAGATIKAHKYLDVSAFYSMTAPNDSLYKHTLGANLHFHRDRLVVGVTALENIYTDSLRYYAENARYNQNYFRGNRQAVIGAYTRYNWGIVDLFAEAAAAQNRQWGWATTAGLRITPVSDVGLMLLYRYYSPTFDNTWGYAFSEGSRINDENGIYLGADVRCVKNWRFSIYGDAFRFADIKYGIPYAPSWGYDTQADIAYLRDIWDTNLRLRAREKGRKSTYSARYAFTWHDGAWRIRTQADANLVTDSLKTLSYGVSTSQDVQYTFQVPITIQLRAQAFDVRNWDNRIYQYENDVLHAYSIPAIYGVGGRFYINLRYRIMDSLSLYVKVAETIYTPTWATMHNRAMSKTDIHLLLRAVL